MAYNFISDVQDIGAFDARFPQDAIKNEPMFFNASSEHAYHNGGPITKSFIAAASLHGWSGAVFDSRVHMLMPGWFPCVPGFHHDDVARGKNGQPDYENMPYKSEHLMGLVNGDICPTVFALGVHSLSKIDDGIVYKAWHNEVEHQIEQNILRRWEAPSGRLVAFDWQSMHSGQRAKKGGWRWFGRLSRRTDRLMGITNEIRRQVQVYLEFPMEGW